MEDQRNRHKQTSSYIRFFALLLGMSVLSFVLVAWVGAGCECTEDEHPSTGVGEDDQEGSDLVEIYGPTEVKPGGRVDLKIGPAPGIALFSSIYWTPPPGATDFEFPGKQPEPGGPPFVFTHVDSSDDLRVSYTAPAEEGKLVDSAFGISINGESGGSAHETKVTDGAFSAKASFPTLLRLTPTRPEATVRVWKVQVLLDIDSITLTTDLCQEWIPKLTGDDFFLAARMPMTTTAITGSYRLPFGNPYSQTLYLDDRTHFNRVMTATLEYRPERHTFLANALPQAAGEHWAALGISTTEPISCPAGLNAAEWTIEADFTLDLHDQPNACEGCTVLFYGCYEGQESLASQATRLLARAMGVESYQGEGITCFGPKPVHLVPRTGNLHISGPMAVEITPTLPATLSAVIVNSTGEAVTLTLGYTSTMGGWQFYGGDWGAPDTNQPIIPGVTEITIPGTGLVSAVVWAANNPVSADTEAGPHSLILTVTSTTSPTLSAWESVPLWSGGWIAPPPPSESKYRVYLPLVTK